MIISIHQPNFLPWFPFFQKISKADIFVIMGHCQFEKNNFQNRFKINDEWQTLRVKKGNDPIIEKKYINAKEDWETIKRKLPEYKNVLQQMDYCISNNLLLTNTKIIKHICKELKITTEIVSDFPTELKRSERLLEICKKFNATHYFSGPSGINYIDSEIFKNSNIDIIYQDNTKLNKTPIIKCLTP